MIPLVQQLRGRQMPPELRDFCDRWRIEEVALFGSILRDDFSDRSDVDFLVRWEPDTHWTLLDRADMKYELEALLDRRVDLVSRRAIEQSENPLRRAAILNTARTIYARPRSTIYLRSDFIRQLQPYLENAIAAKLRCSLQICLLAWANSVVS